MPKADPSRLDAWDCIVESDLWRRLPKSPGCYALAQDGRIVYVGQAVNLRTRVSQHICRPGGFPCNSIRWAQCVALELDRLERSLIAHHMPAYNRRRGKG